MTKLSDNPNSKKVYNVRAFEVVKDIFIYILERGPDILLRIHIDVNTGVYEIAVNNINNYAVLQSELALCFRLLKGYYSVD